MGAVALAVAAAAGAGYWASRGRGQQGKPGPTGPAAVTTTEGTWAFEPVPDAFSPDALLDLRPLNEEVAGVSGFVGRTADGAGFALGDGTPVRFWAVTPYVQRGGEPGALEHHARFLAKRGVNMVRYHGQLGPKAKGDPDVALDEPDRGGIDEAWRLVAAMKAEGIYTTISPYWAHAMTPVPARWGIEGWPEGKAPNGLLYFNDALRDAYKRWLRDLLSEPNPYTGIPLAEDPALAIIQLQNEDSMLFWTMQDVEGRQLEALGRKFGDWLARQYGSIGAAARSWGGDRMDGDDFDRGVVGIHLVWEWTQPRGGGRKARLDDQLRFFAETMRDFNREIGRYLREDLGCRQLVNAGNWKTADPIRLGDVERWTYTANDVVAVNRYYSPVHVGPDRGWRIDAGDRYVDASALRDPRGMPTNIRQVAGFPTILSETRWVPPSGYQSESPFLMAAYAGLCGIDGIYWFSTAEPEWSIEDRAEWDAASRKKWDVGNPMVLGQFPAAALAYRRGDIAEGAPAVVEHRGLDDLWGRRAPIIAEDPSYDPNRDLGDAARRPDLDGVVDPRAFLVGPVVVDFGRRGAAAEVAGLGRYIDGDRIDSITGQVSLDAGAGVCTIDAPRAQGAAGFLGDRGAVELADLAVRTEMPYAAILAVALDGEPLATSRRVLVQIGTVARPEGWSARPTRFEAEGGGGVLEGQRIESTGGMPWRIAEGLGSIEVRNSVLSDAVALDPNGMPTAAIPVERRGDALRLELSIDALYVVLRAD